MNQRTRKVKLRNDATPKALIYHYDLQGNLISETREDGRPIQDYIWVNATPIAQIKVRRDNKGVLKHQKLLYLHTDHLNTPRLATDATQTVIWRWAGDAFGQTKPDKDPDGDGTKVNVRLRFPGQYHDGESGLYYNWNRYYDPRTGRYVTSDPIGLEGELNTYVYVDNNPSKFIDPDGLLPVMPWPDRGPFGPVCGPEGKDLATWIPDGVFTQACGSHDKCYNCSGRSRKSCDDQFCRKLLEACHKKYGSRFGR